MTITLGECLEVIEHRLPGKPRTPLEGAGLVNQAGRWLVSVHAWEWLKGRAIDLEARAKTTVTSANWTASSRTITDTGAFADYTFLAGDQLKITSGTGLLAGFHTIESRTDDDAIVLKDTIIATDIVDSSINGEMQNDQIALPTDFSFQKIEAYAASNGLVQTLSFTTRQNLLDLRTADPALSTLNHWATISYFLDDTAGNTGSQPIQRLEFYPPLSAADRFIRLFYVAGWKTLGASDSEIVPVPDFMEMFFLEACKAVALGHGKERESDMMDRQDKLLISRTFMELKQRDGTFQRDLGPIQGGAMEVFRTRSHFDNESTVGNPL